MNRLVGPGSIPSLLAVPILPLHHLGSNPVFDALEQQQDQQVHKDGRGNIMATPVAKQKSRLARSLAQ
jgi:hypothetical protein